MSENQTPKQYYWMLAAEIRLLIRHERQEPYSSAVLQNAVLTTESRYITAADLQRANRVVIQQFLQQALAAGETAETVQPQGATFVAITCLGQMTKEEWEAGVASTEIAA